MSAAALPRGVSRLARPSALAVAAASVLAATAGTVIAVRYQPAVALSGHVYEDLVLALVWSALGALLVRRLPRHLFGPLFVAIGASHALATLASQYALAATRASWPAAVPAAWLGGWVWALGMFVPLTFVLLLFPDGRLPSPRWRPVAYAAGIGLTGVALSLALAERIQLGPQTSVPSPLAVPAAGAAFAASSTVVVVAAVGSVTALVRRLRSATGERRRQLAPVVAAGIVVLPASLAAAALPSWGPIIQTLTLPLLPLAAALAILRYRLYDIEVVVRRSLVFLGLTALIIGGYALVVQATASLLQRSAGLPESLVATGAVALAFQPVRAYLQRLVSRGLYGERDEPYAALARVGEQLAGAADPDTALREAARHLVRALRLPWAAVHGMAEALAEAGKRPRWAADAELQRVPLVHLGEVKGELVVARRGPREHLSAADRELLDRLAMPLASAVASRQLADDLQRSRERLVAAREEERRRLRRDLHDGLGPTLAAVATQLDVAELRMRRDPAVAAELLRTLRGMTQDAVLDVRRVVEDLRPPALDDLGLHGALAELSARLSVPDGAHIEVHSTALPSLPAAVEVAAYRIAAEAITNALRHGSPRHVDVRITHAGEGLTLRVSDDGSGLPPPSAAATGGVGLTSMRDRAEEIGGTLTISSGRGGTVVRAALPLSDRSPCAGDHL